MKKTRTVNEYSYLMISQYNLPTDITPVTLSMEAVILAETAFDAGLLFHEHLRKIYGISEYELLCKQITKERYRVTHTTTSVDEQKQFGWNIRTFMIFKNNRVIYAKYKIPTEKRSYNADWIAYVLIGLGALFVLLTALRPYLGF